MWEKIVRFLEELVETQILIPVLFLVFGVAFLMMGTTEVLSKFGISVTDQPGRYILVLFGGIGMIAAVIFAYPILFKEEAAHRTSQKKYPGFSIDKPAEGAYMPAPYAVTGKGKPLPGKFKLYLFTISNDNKKYWPQTEIDVDNAGTWTVNLDPGAFGRTGTIKIAAYVLGVDGQALIKHYDVAHDEIKLIDRNAETPGISALTSDFARVTETRTVHRV